MKKNLNFYFRIIAIILTFSTPLSSIGQRINPIQNQSNTSEYSFRVDNYTPSNNGVVLSHLWWFGDNGYSFLANPTHTFFNGTGKKPSVVMTEGYGTGGPPPLRCQTTLKSPVPAPPTRSLSPGRYIRIQNYRKAVAKDTVYFIVTYAKPKNSNFSNGAVKINIDNATNYLDAFVANNRDFLPNQESAILNNNAPTEIDVTFTNLDSTERSILIPVYVGINNKRKLNFSASINFEASKEVYRDDISLPMRHSQDPNQMTEVSFSDDNNSGDIYTPCE